MYSLIRYKLIITNKIKILEESNLTFGFSDYNELQMCQIMRINIMYIIKFNSLIILCIYPFILKIDTLNYIVAPLLQWYK